MEVNGVNNYFRINLRPLFCIFVLMLGLSGCVIPSQDHPRIRSLEDVQHLIREKSWSHAIEELVRLYRIDQDPLVAETLLSVLDEIMKDTVNILEPESEIAFIRWLNETQDPGTLAEFMDMRKAMIPAGKFIMGSIEGENDELPLHNVYLDSFLIDRFEVTNAQYQRFLIETGEAPPRYWDKQIFPAGQGDVPVVGISWRQADAYCTWRGGRLPTEAEWERACRGDHGSTYPWGEDWDKNRANTGMLQGDFWPRRQDDAWVILSNEIARETSAGLTPVGSYLIGVSPYGLNDMVGNASEWVFDYYNWEGYWDLPSTNPVSIEPPWNHSIRGNAWFHLFGLVSEVPNLSRCSNRNSSHSYDDPRVGFRCAYNISFE
jgi:sulfatase modifying factor 1